MDGYGNKERQAARQMEADVMRGIAIILVVLGHAIRGSIQSVDEPSRALLFSDWLIYSFHMPVFFYLGGYYTATSLLRGSATDFACSRLTKVVWPYVLWSLIYFAAAQAMSRVTTINEPITWQQVASIGWAPIHVLWFLHAFLIMQLIAIAAVRAPFPALLVSVVVDAAVTLYAGSEHFDARIAYHAPFFFAGLWLATRENPPQLAESSNSLIAAGSVVVFIGFAYALFALGTNPPVSFLTLPLGIAGVAMVALVSRNLVLETRTATSVLSALGRASLAIYLLHVLVLALVPRALRALDVSSIGARLIVGTLVGTLASYGIFVALKRMRLANGLGLR